MPVADLNKFDFNLPEELIAKYPLDERDASRMLYYNSDSQTIKHLNFKNIIDLLKTGDILVRNCSRVLAARFYVYSLRQLINFYQNKLKLSSDQLLKLEKENKLNPKQIEILLSSYDKNNLWSALAKPAKKIKNNDLLILEDPFINLNKDDLAKALKNPDILLACLKLKASKQGDNINIEFASDSDFRTVIETYGSMPIPPYFKRQAEELDKERYQTIYAREFSKSASIAAPTAGLHFTDLINKQLEAKGVEIIDLELHVGLGTFAPIRDEDYSKHKMHSEKYYISEKNWQKIQKAKSNEQRIIAVGSTSTRCLESVAQSGQLSGETNIYIYPGKHKFKIVDAMVTNFHLPKSSLILMIAAFIGEEDVMKVYDDALKQKYRFYSYGDCCFFETKV